MDRVAEQKQTCWKYTTLTTSSHVGLVHRVFSHASRLFPLLACSLPFCLKTSFNLGRAWLHIAKPTPFMEGLLPYHLCCQPYYGELVHPGRADDQFMCSVIHCCQLTSTLELNLCGSYISAQISKYDSPPCEINLHERSNHEIANPIMSSNHGF